MSSFYELSNIPYLTDDEFEEIFENFKIAYMTEPDYWYECWWQCNDIDSIVTYRPPKPETPEVFNHRIFKTGYYHHDVTFKEIERRVEQNSDDVYRNNGEMSHLYEVVPSGIKELHDRVTEEFRQLTEFQLVRIREFCYLYNDIKSL